MLDRRRLSIEDLPNDYMLHLFTNFLDFNSRLEVEKVCKLWYQLIRLSFDIKRCLIISDYELHENRIKRLNLSQRRVSIVKMVSFHLIERTELKDRKFISLIVRKYSSLETLCLCLKFTKCSSKILELICKYCSKTLINLRIEMSDCSVNNRTLFIQHEEVRLMSEQFRRLRYLYLDFVILFIHEQTLHTIFTECPRIETIIFHTPCFRGCVYNSELENTLSQEFVGDNFETFGQSIVKLELPGNVLNLNAIRRLPETTNLKRLLIFKLNLNCIETICKKFPKLNYFGFSIENNINEEDMYSLMENVGHLRHLDQLYMAIMSGVAINYNCIKLLRSCHRLSSLQIDQTLMSREGVDAISRYFPDIEDLQLWTSGLNQNFHHCLNDSIIANVKKLRSLKSLNFRGQRNISDNSIANIVSNCPLLRIIDVRTTKAAIVTLQALISKSQTFGTTIEAFIHETPISRLFGQEIKRFEISKNLMLSNEDYDYKINF